MGLKVVGSNLGMFFGNTSSGRVLDRFDQHIQALSSAVDISLQLQDKRQ